MRFSAVRQKTIFLSFFFSPTPCRPPPPHAHPQSFVMTVQVWIQYLGKEVFYCFEAGVWLVFWTWAVGVLYYSKVLVR